MPTEENPGGGTGALENLATGCTQSSETDHGSLVPEWAHDDRAREHRELESRVVEAGYRLAVRCRACKQWLVEPKSVREHLGPVCRGRRHV